MKIAIITDSTAVMTKENLETYNHLYTIPLQILMGEDVYKDGIDLQPSSFFELMSTSTILPTTSQPSVGDVLTLFEKLEKDYDQIIYITISSKISGTYNTGVLAKNQMDNDQIFVFDSLNTSVIMQRFVLEACRLSNEGHDAKSILNHLETLRENSSIYLVVDDLKHLGRTGRVNNVSAVVGALLKIKPILRFEDGFINLYKKIRTINKAHNEVFDVINNEALKNSSFVMIAHADGYDYAMKMKQRLSLLYPDKEIVVSDLSPVISVHTGPKTLGVGWIK